MTARRILSFLLDLLVMCAVAAVVLVCLGYFIYAGIVFLFVALGALVVMSR